MNCEILKSECNIENNDCSKCEAARKAVEKATKDYLMRNYAVISNFDVIKSTSIEDGSGTIATMWFQNPVAEVAHGVLKVAKHDL